MIFAKIKLGQTQSGKPVVEMYTNNARLKYPELRLFELSELQAVGIAPNKLVKGDAQSCRFWAY